MKTSRFTNEQIVLAPRQAEGGTPAVEVCRALGVSKPTDNAFIEAFNSLVRRERLSQHYFSTLEEARHVLEMWRQEYNNHRPHGSLGDRTPAEYKAGGYYVPDRNRLLILRA